MSYDWLLVVTVKQGVSICSPEICAHVHPPLNTPLFQTIQACFGQVRPQKSSNFSFSKLNIELLKQLESSRTYTNFIEPLLPKKQNEHPGVCACVSVCVCLCAGAFVCVCVCVCVCACVSSLLCVYVQARQRGCKVPFSPRCTQN